MTLAGGHCAAVVAGDWQPMLDLSPLFEVRTLSGLAARIEYDF